MCVQVGARVCACVFMCLRVCIFGLCMRKRASMYMGVSMRVCLRVRVGEYVHMRVYCCVCVCRCVAMLARACGMWVPVCMCTCLCVCAYV